MEFLDVGIIILLVLGAFEGFKAGFTKSLVNCVGLIIIIILAFVLKNPVSEFLMLHLPFFDYYGFIKGVPVLNIVVYEIIAFALVFMVLSVALKIVLFTTSIFEKILSFTIILGFPSKIVGAMIGLIKNFVIVFAILYILSLPGLSSNSIVQSSKFREPILENTPLLSGFADNTLKVFEEFASIKDKYTDTKNNNDFNLETLELFLKYGIVKADLVEKLIKIDKLHIENAEELISKYKE